MAAITGVLGRVTVGGNTVAELTGFSIDESANMISDSELTDAVETSIAGRTSWSGSIECMWSDGDTAQAAMTIGASVALIFLPEGPTGGSAKYNGTAIIESRGLAVSDEAIITQSFSVKGNGALTIGTV